MSYFREILTAEAHALFLPSKMKDEIQRYVRMHQSGATRNLEGVPFSRQLDFWVLALATAVAQDATVTPSQSRQAGHKFANTKSVELSDGLCELLAVVALGALGVDHESVGDPARIIEVANQYAAAGCEELLYQLRNPHQRLTRLEKAINFATGCIVD